MKNKRIYFLSLLFAFVIFAESLAPMVFAIDANDEKAYFAQVAQIMAGYLRDPEMAKEELQKIDTVLLTEPEVSHHYNSSASRGTVPTDYSLSVYSFQRGNVSSNYYLQWTLTANANELFPGPLDYICFEWDETRASYYSSSGDSTFTTVSSRNTGVVTFNVQDADMDNGDYTYGTVIVSPNVSTDFGGWMEFGARYEHTYTSFLVSGSASYSYKPSAEIEAEGIPTLGLEKGFSIKVDLGTGTTSWFLWSDNAVLLG